MAMVPMTLGDPNLQQEAKLLLGRPTVLPQS